MTCIGIFQLPLMRMSIEISTDENFSCSIWWTDLCLERLNRCVIYAHEKPMWIVNIDISHDEHVVFKRHEIFISQSLTNCYYCLISSEEIYLKDRYDVIWLNTKQIDQYTNEVTFLSIENEKVELFSLDLQLQWTFK